MAVVTIVAKALVKAARAIMKIKGIKGIVGTSPEGVKKALRIISRSGKEKAIQALIAKSPSKVTLAEIRKILQEGTQLSEAALKESKIPTMNFLSRK